MILSVLCNYFLIFIFLFEGEILGKSAGSLTGNGHNGDIVKVLGLDLSDERQHILANEITIVFAKYLDSQDDANSLNYEIKKIAPGFTWGTYTHRIFFHWGFSGDPRKSKALSDKVENCGGSRQDIQKIWDLVIGVQAKRNREMMNALQEALIRKNGFFTDNLTRDERHALASVIYDVHILGDYIEGTVMSFSTLLGLEQLRKDIIKSSRDLGSTDDKSLHDIKVAFDEASVLTDPKQQAEKLLSHMKNYLPRILKSSTRMKKALY